MNAVRRYSYVEEGIILTGRDVEPTKDINKIPLFCGYSYTYCFWGRYLSDAQCMGIIQFLIFEQQHTLFTPCIMRTYTYCANGWFHEHRVVVASVHSRGIAIFTWDISSRLPDFSLDRRRAH